MDQARLYAPQKEINANQAGRIDGGFKLDNTIDCPVKVIVTLRVPSGMTISGGSDWESAGAGLVSTSFVLNPGTNIKDLSANVFSQETGRLRVTGDIEYWPVGHDEMSKEIDGISMVFQVTEPNDGPDESEPWPLPIDPIILGLMGLVALAIVGMVMIGPDAINIGIGK
jgi:hypothetical protein